MPTPIPIEVLDSVIAGREGGLSQLRFMRWQIDREFARQIRAETAKLRELKKNRREQRKGKK